jgi:hypothetical protein
MLKQQGNEYRFMPFHLGPKPICNLARDGIYVYPELASMSTHPYPFVCPLNVSFVTFDQQFD